MDECSAPEAFPEEVAARLARRVALLLGSVPLEEMTQEEADWLFRARVRTAGGESS